MPEAVFTHNDCRARKCSGEEANLKRLYTVRVRDITLLKRQNYRMKNRSAVARRRGVDAGREGRREAGVIIEQQLEGSL